jgi:hypothetical protein
MIRIARSLIPFALLLALSACDKKPAAPTAQPAAPAPTAATPAASPPVVRTADAVGVAECDDYLTKYEACINGKVPEAQRVTFKQTLDQTRAAWKSVAASAGGKEGLATACKQAHDGSKAAMAQYGCTDF